MTRGHPELFFRVHPQKTIRSSGQRIFHIPAHWWPMSGVGLEQCVPPKKRPAIFIKIHQRASSTGIAADKFQSDASHFPQFRRVAVAIASWR